MSTSVPQDGEATYVGTTTPRGVGAAADSVHVAYDGFARYVDTIYDQDVVGDVPPVSR